MPACDLVLNSTTNCLPTYDGWHWIGWTYPTYPTTTITVGGYYPQHGIELAAVCDHCQKRQKLTYAAIPADWVTISGNGKHAVLCSFACAEKFSKSFAKK